MVRHEPDAAVEETEAREGRGDRLRRHRARPHLRAVARIAGVERAVLAAGDDQLARAAEAVVGMHHERTVQEAEVMVEGRCDAGPVTEEQSAEFRHSIDPSLAHAPNCSGGSTRVFQTTPPVAASTLRIESSSPIDGKVKHPTVFT